MKTITIALITLTCFCFLFASAAPAATTTADMPATKSQKEFSDQDRMKPAVHPDVNDGFTCPKTKYIDCMPPVPKEKQQMCSRNYLTWVAEYCPGVKVVY